jgi:hypothetical protein
MAVFRDKPYGPFNFTVALGGAQGDGSPGSVIGGFSEVSGLGMEVTYSEYRKGNEKLNTVRKIPGVHKVGEWWSNTNRGRRDLRDVTIHQLGSDGETLVNTWLLCRCSPRRWTGPEFIALGEGIAFEEIEFTYQKLEWL